MATTTTNANPNMPIQGDPLLAGMGTAQTPAQMAAANKVNVGQGSIDPTLTSSPIPASTIGTTAAPLPNPPTPSDYSGLSTTGIGTVNANNGTLTSSTPTTPTTDATTQGFLEKYLGIKPPSATDQYNADYAAAGVDAKQTDANTKNQALLDAQSKLNAINAQLQGVTANADAIQIQAQQDATGRGVTAGGLAPLTSAQLRNNALQAIPLQAQALVAQAQVASAQGNATLAQSILQQAQDHVDKLFQVHMTDATNQYNYQKDVVSTLMDYASKADQKKLDALNAQKQQDFTNQQNQLNNAQALANTAIQNGQGDIAGKILGLDPTSPTYAQDVAKYAGQITQNPLDVQLKQAQIGSANRANQNAWGSGLLSVSEAQSLGVPYGTTQAQAAGAGITPQKQATAAQETTALYANRIEQSNSIISKLDQNVANMNPVQYAAYQKTPQVLNFLKSGDFQSVDQAQRNFVNAVLRRESGAVISPEEFNNARQQYFVMPGDTPQTIAQKKANRDLVQQGFISGAGQAYTPLVAPSATVTKSGAAFDTTAAKAAGYTQAEIDAYLASH